MSEDFAGWISFWKWVLIVGLSFYFVIAIVVVPFGYLDIRKLFRRLDQISAEHERKKQSNE
ncbi:MAG: hypothetical protein U1D30_17035 [Planctomycetota bacterium]